MHKMDTIIIKESTPLIHPTNYMTNTQNQTHEIAQKDDTSQEQPEEPQGEYIGVFWMEI
jgi:hypothetical protein